MRPKPPHRDDILAVVEPIIASRRKVRFQDVDAAGTIFFPRVLEYFADVYLLLLETSGLDVPRSLREKAYAAPVVHAEADFLAPLLFGDEVDVEIALAQVGETSVVFGHRIWKLRARKEAPSESSTERERVPAAIGHTVHVFVDGQSFKPIALPDPLRQRLAKHTPTAG